MNAQAGAPADRVFCDLDRQARANDRARSRARPCRARPPACTPGGVGAERRVTVTGSVREQFFVERKKAYRQNLKFFLYIAHAPRNG